MKVTVIGGTGLIGSKVVAALAGDGHEAVAASPDTGVDTLTGEGLADAVAGAGAVVDVSNSPSFEDAAVMDFFTTSTGNILAAEAAAGVPHHVALSVVGTNWLTGSGYFRAKNAQEDLITASGIPYTIVRATQFFEFVERIAASATVGDTIRVAPALVQPIAADDVALAVARAAVGAPAGGVVEVAGPEEFRFDVFIDRWLRTRDDPRGITTDQTVPYFGAVLDERDLLPQFTATLGAIRYADWLSRSAPAPGAGPAVPTAA
jgi:uncharacterized protein YbjT (DUF2867 family)